VTRVHIVYAHPSDQSFTHDVLAAFRAGLDEAGHDHTLSDLYAMDFRSEMSREEYDRESGARPDAPLPPDVAAEHALLAAAEVWTFVYPVWWNDCPARLKGWFDRVWTVGVAYKPTRLGPADKALVLCTAGYSLADLEASGCHEAMRTTMLGDRIGARARAAELVVFGGSARLDGVSEPWSVTRAGHLAGARELGSSIGAAGS
jgi:NAD(P)H dehydrogenase (quinone)